MSEHTSDAGLRAEVERVLRESGLTDKPDEHDSDIHSWRCRHPYFYGPCSCFAELVDDLTRVIQPGLGDKQTSKKEGR